MGAFIEKAWMKATTPTNIDSGFRSAGIWPFDGEVYGDDDFASSLPSEQSALQPDHQQDNTLHVNISIQQVPIPSCPSSQR